jgi:AraC family transcriptional regulator of arabinose operon
LSHEFTLLAHGLTRCPPEWGMVDEKTEFHRIYFIYGGTCWYRDDFEHFKLVPGNIYLFPTNQSYTMQHDPADPLMTLWYHVKLYPDVGRGCITKAVEPNSPLDQLLQTMAAFEQASVPVEQIRSLVDVLLAQLSQLLVFVDEPDERINEVLAYIRKNISRDLQISTLARQVRMERSYFTRYFKAALGISPQAFILQRRMDLAANLLLKGQPVKTVSTAVGYASEKAFSRAFQKVVHCSPMSYRSNPRTLP